MKTNIKNLRVSTNTASNNIFSEATYRQEQTLHASLLVVVMLLLIGTISVLTSCQSPVNIDTPRTTKPDIIWNTTINRQTGQVQDNVAKVNGVEPEATFALNRVTYVYAPDIPTTASVSQLGYVGVTFFKDSTAQHQMSITADGPGYQNYRLYTTPGRAFLTPYIVVKDVNTATPLQFNTTTYPLSDNKLEWLGKVEITSHKNGSPVFSPTAITRGQPLVVRWVSDVVGADGAELVIYAWVVRQNPDGSVSGIGPVILKKTFNPTGVSEVQFTADEMNTLPAGSNFALRVRYFKAKTANDGKVLLYSESMGTVNGMVK